MRTIAYGSVVKAADSSPSASEQEPGESTMTVDYESLAMLLPITFTALFAIAFAVGLFQQWAASRKQVHVDFRHECRRAQPGETGRDRR